MYKQGTNVSSPWAHGGIIDQVINGATLLKWFKTCHDNQNNLHHDCINSQVWATGGAGSSRRGLSHLRLFNVQSNKIEDFKPTPTQPFPTYVALSYMIGKDVQLPTLSLEDLQKLEKHPKDPEDLPMIYYDAIKVVRDMLKLQYLWIDALCLVGVPEDDDDHVEGIDNMDRIYNQAVLTIVAADGDNADWVLGAIHDRSENFPQDWIAIPSSNKKWGIVTGLY